MRAAPILGICLLAAACGAQPDPANVMDNVTAQAAADARKPLTDGGWAALFASPEDAIHALKGTGFRPGDYTAKGKAYQATGIRTVLSDSETEAQNLFYTVVAGSKDAVDAIRFEIELSDAPQAAKAKKSLLSAMDVAFKKIGVPGVDAIRKPILDEKDAAGTVPGAAWTVERKPLTGKDARRLTVTFTPAAASAAETQPRKQ